jgi:hypothetical protein
MIYNSFVWAQLFNLINSRKLYNELNPFDGVLSNRCACQWPPPTPLFIIYVFLFNLHVHVSVSRMHLLFYSVHPQCSTAECLSGSLPPAQRCK